MLLFYKLNKNQQCCLFARNHTPARVLGLFLHHFLVCQFGSELVDSKDIKLNDSLDHMDFILQMSYRVASEVFDDCQENKRGK